MYQNIYFQREMNGPGKIHLWDDEKGYFVIKYDRYAYKENKYGKHVSLNGKKLSLIRKWNKNEEGLYESDVRPEIRTLIDLYYESDMISKNHIVMFFDIEVSIKDGFPSIKDADNEIISIAYHIREQDYSVVLILDQEGRIKDKIEDNKEIIVYQNEQDLLNAFISQINKIKPTILSTWNGDAFDIPYLYRRITKILGRNKANKLSPINRCDEFKDGLGYSIAGISSMDYMRLFKGFTEGERSSYSLDFISNEELNRGKIKYDGTLKDLYDVDINKFIEYNLEDVLLLRDLDKKLNFIELAQGICHKGHVPYEYIYSPGIYLDGAALTYMKRSGVVAPDRKKIFDFKLAFKSNVGDDKLYFEEKIKNIPDKGTLKIHKSTSSSFSIIYRKYIENYIVLEQPLNEEIKLEYNIALELPGAYVKQPKPGLYEWIYDLDLTSLYPSIIMSLNISPETKIGRIIDWNTDDWIREKERDYHIHIKSRKEKKSFKEIQKFIIDNDYSVSVSGVLYRQDTIGFLPAILRNWFSERSDMKRRRDEHGNKGNKSKYLYYDNRQKVYKVLLNSFYGVLSLPVFRFYDLDNAESITLSGQNIIKFTIKITDNFYQKILKNKNSYAIYGDTDSCFYSIMPLLEKLYPGTDVTNIDQMTKKILSITKKVQNYINKFYDIYAKKYHNCKNHFFNIKQEIISKSGFWVAKKRYAQWMIFKEGVPVDEIDIKGIDVVRSDFSLAFKNVLKEILIDILNKKTNEEVNKKILSFKRNMDQFNLNDFMFPVGVKNVTKYDINREPFQILLKTPINVKSSLYYNDVLDYYKLNTGYIVDGEKIKWAYLKKNPFNIKCIALKENAPKVVKDFINTYIDKEKMFDSRIRSKLNDFYDSLNWTMSLNEKANEFFNF